MSQKENEFKNLKHHHFTQRHLHDHLPYDLQQPFSHYHHHHTHQQQKQKQQNHIRLKVNANSSSSGNSSLKSGSSSSGLNSEQHSSASSSRSTSSNGNAKSVHRQVRFRLEKSSTLKERRETGIEFGVGGQLQTVQNELSQIKAQLDSKTQRRSEHIQALLASVYEDNLRDAHAITNKLADKLRQRGALTSQLYENAYGRNLAMSTNGPRRVDATSLTPSMSSRAKGVLLPPQSKSLQSVRGGLVGVRRSSENRNEKEEGEASLGLGRRRSSSLVDTHGDHDNDDLVFMLNDLRRRSDLRGSTTSLKW